MKKIFTHLKCRKIIFTKWLTNIYNWCKMYIVLYGFFWRIVQNNKLTRREHYEEDYRNASGRHDAPEPVRMHC
jgi:hypothetical protein